MQLTNWISLAHEEIIEGSDIIEVIRYGNVATLSAILV